MIIDRDNLISATDSEKLELLAKWFDKKYPNEPTEVQDDLRRIATRIAELEKKLADRDELLTSIFFS